MNKGNTYVKNSPVLINASSILYEGGGKTLDKLFDLVYPVGSIYLSVNDTNPKDLFGGTWVKVVGQYLLAWDCEYGWVGGGWNTHDTVLTIDQIPSHNHPMLANKNAGGQNAGIEHTWGTAYSGYDNNSCGYTGGGQGHHHYFEPPYFKCSVWYRTA